MATISSDEPPVLCWSDRTTGVANKEFRSGDLIWSSPGFLFNPDSELADAILSTGQASMQWLAGHGMPVAGNEISTHVAIAKRSNDGTLSFLEALPGKGVVEMPVAEYFGRQAESTVFYRGSVNIGSITAMDPAEFIGSMLQIAEAQLGKQYATDFDMPPDRFYCSSLVDFAFTAAAGRTETVFLPPGVPEFKLLHEPLGFWQDYYRKFGMAVPVDVKGSNPTLLLHSPIVQFEQLRILKE